MRHGLIPSIDTVFSRQSHYINYCGIRPFLFILNGTAVIKHIKQQDFKSRVDQYLACVLSAHNLLFLPYNEERPHDSLEDLPPWEYLAKHEPSETLLVHANN